MSWRRPVGAGVCAECGEELGVNAWSIARVEVFCGNEDCSRFVRAFWIDRPKGWRIP